VTKTCLSSVLWVLLANALMVGCIHRATAPDVTVTPEPFPTETREACYAKMVAIDSELVGHVVSLESGSHCASNNDCVVVDVGTSCLSSCPNVVAQDDLSELKKRLATSDAKWCRGPAECTMQSMCARTTAVCDGGRCRAKWDGLVQ
jgi:hypothetical protein